MFSKAKSLFQLIRRGSTFGAEHMLKNNLSGQGRTESQSLDLHRLREAFSVTEFADVDPISSDRINETVADGTLALDFQVETGAEEFFNNSHGEQAKGTFQKVEVVRWEHDETDWKIEAVEFTPPCKPGRQTTHSERCSRICNSRACYCFITRLAISKVKSRARKAWEPENQTGSIRCKRSELSSGAMRQYLGDNV